MRLTKDRYWNFRPNYLFPRFALLHQRMKGFSILELRVSLGKSVYSLTLYV